MTDYVPEGEAVGGGVEEPLAAKGGAPLDEQADVDSPVSPAGGENTPDVTADEQRADAPQDEPADVATAGRASAERLADAAEGQAGEAIAEVPTEVPAEAPAGVGKPAAEEAEREPHRDVAMSLKETLRLLAERTDDLQRLQAEYVNYKRRVDRDRDQARAAGVESVVLDLLPVLDAIHLAEAHEELTGGFKAVADEIGRLAAKHGVTAYGEPGEAFDPQVHEALMAAPGEPGQAEPLVAQVLQTGYRAKDRIVRYARVAVSEPVPAAAAE